MCVEAVDPLEVLLVAFVGEVRIRALRVPRVERVEADDEESFRRKETLTALENL